jgi:hypothetical protein
MKNSGDVMMCVVKQGSALTTKLSNSSDLTLRLDAIDGTMVLYSMKPPSPKLYHLEYEYTLGYARVRLTPIV